MKAINLIIILAIIIVTVLPGCRQIFGDGEQPDSILQIPDEASEIIVTSPTHGSIWKLGDTIKIKWLANSINSLDLELYRKSEFQIIISENVENSGGYSWKIPDNINLSNHYLIKIINHNNPDTYQFSGRFGIQ